MRSLPLLLVVAAALLAPGQALAAGSASGPTARYFEITGLVLGDQKYDASGKLAIQGDQLGASVGCNSIGGTVSVDGDVVTVTQSLIQTEMACPGVAMDTEAALVKILQDHGPFHISSTSWDGNGAQILVMEIDAPAPGRSLPPDQPVCSNTDPNCGGVVRPMPSCPPIQIDPGFGGGATGSGGASGSGGGSTGSGSSEGSTGTGSAGENPTGTAVAEPVEVPPATPASEPGGNPDPNASAAPEATAQPVDPGVSGDPGIVPPAPPAPDQTPGLDQGPEPSIGVVEPAPSAIAVPDPGTGTTPGIGTDPGIGKPPVDDPCARSYANDATAGSGAGAVPPQADGSVTAAEHSKSASEAQTAAQAAVIEGGLFLLGFAALGARRRWLASRPGSEADASR